MRAQTVDTRSLFGGGVWPGNMAVHFHAYSSHSSDNSYTVHDRCTTILHSQLYSGVLVGAVIIQRTLQTTARQRRQGLYTVGVHNSES